MTFYGASASSHIPRYRWDVFLSFRGEDTRKTFTDHLCKALRQERIHTFMDDKLQSGEEISPTLYKAIEESKISIIVLSKNYASSQWCLRELKKILKCRKKLGQHVLPLFYNVDPSEVRHQTNSVGEAFAKLDKKLKVEKWDKVEKWKKALTKVSNLSGKHLKNYRTKSELFSEIIEWVNSILEDKTCDAGSSASSCFKVAQYPVGINSYLQDVKSCYMYGRDLLNQTTVSQDTCIGTEFFEDKKTTQKSITESIGFMLNINNEQRYRKTYNEQFFSDEEWSSSN